MRRSAAAETIGRWRVPIAVTVALLAAALAIGPPLADAGATVKQPRQPQSGPGGSEYPHRGFRVSSGGAGSDAWYTFEPVRPRPARAPVAIILHGYGEFAGYDTMSGLIEHTVRHGAVVIYPRWQTGIATPCPGPFQIEPCMAAASTGIHAAIEHLRASDARVQPRLGKASYFGFSFGGIVTANLLNRWRSYELPRPHAIFLDDPHDGALTGPDEPALDDDLGGIPSSALVQCHSGADGVLGEVSLSGESLADGSCNALFPKLTSVPAANKDLVLTHTDDHGRPPLDSAHGVCTGGRRSASGEPDAYDWSFCWKVWDAIRSCALEHRYCRYALGPTRRHRSIGRWSDGVPVTPLAVRNRAPIRP
jgi:hypothetical protein